MNNRVLDLFSGVGGFSLGFERAGFETVAFCEINPYCRAVLARHWPKVPCYDDIRTLDAAALRRDGIAVDVICGGFPCQDISIAGNGAGIEGERSGLWSEYRRLIGELRPRVVIVENVAALLGRGLGDVLRDLSALGYDAVWDCIPAEAVGAPHRRDRVWIVAHTHSSGRAARDWHLPPSGHRSTTASGRGDVICHPDCQGLAIGEGIGRHAGEELQTPVGADWWLSQSDVRRVDDELSEKLDGNP